MSFALGVVLTLGERSLSAAHSTPKQAALAAPHSAPAPRDGPAPLTGGKGPWGTLELQRIQLQNSEEMFGDRESRLKPTRWVFENYSELRLSELLLSCELSERQRAILLDTKHWEVLSNGYAISPGDDLVMGLSRSTRQRLFPLLAKSQQNYPQCWPTRFRPDGFEEEFAESGLPLERIQAIKGLTYTNQGYLCLCVDRPFLTSLPTNEFQNVIRTIYSLPTYSVRLRVSPDSDIDELLKYWGKGRSEKTTRPLLESLARKLVLLSAIRPDAALHLSRHLNGSGFAERGLFLHGAEFLQFATGPQVHGQHGDEQNLERGVP
jgi:hypothetical protein